MRLWTQLTSRPRWAIASVTVLAAIVLLARLGSFGLWDPYEVNAVRAFDDKDTAASEHDPHHRATDASKSAAKKSADQTPAGEKARGDDGAREHAERQPCPDAVARAPLRSQLSRAGASAIGDELGARLPLAVCGILIVLLTAIFGQLLAGPRAALLSGLVALTFPGLVLASRQVTGDPVTMLCATLMLVSGAVVFWPQAPMRWWQPLLAAIGVAVATVAGERAGGLLLGVVAPAGSLAMAGLAFSMAAALRWRRAGSLPREHVRVFALTAVFGAISVTALVLCMREVFDVAAAGTKDLQLAGHTLAACLGKTHAVMGAWQPEGNLDVDFNALFETIAYGAFPWVAVAPIAVTRLGFADTLDRKALLGYLLFAWAGVTWIIGGVLERKVGPVFYPALPALAVAIGAWLDRAWPRAPEEHRPAPLLALFIGLAAVVLSKDLGEFPDLLTGLTVAGGKYPVPEGSHAHVFVIAMGLTFAGLTFAGLALPRGSDPKARLARLLSLALPAALIASLAASLFLAHVWTPVLSRKLSPRHTFDSLRSVRRPGEALGVLGHLGDGPAYYAGDDVTILSNRTSLYQFLGSTERVFALVPVGDLCSIHYAQPVQGFEYHVLDDENTKLLLLSNRLGPGETDRNRLLPFIQRERPADVGTPMSVDFDGKLELIGVRMPKAVDRGDVFEMSLIFRVKQRLRRSWNIFIHFDGAGSRFQGDHKPSEMFCPATQWRPGDTIVDTVTVQAGHLTNPRGRYRVWMGLFTGSAGNWTNMKVNTKGADEANRFPIGFLDVR